MTTPSNNLIVALAFIASLAWIQSVAAQSINDNRGIVTQDQQGNNFLTPPGGTVIQNSNGGIGADISVTGSRDCAPTTGLDTHGLTVVQSGSGTGMKVTVGGGCGLTTGVRSSVGNH
ncbi:MAG: hypothetical protein P4M15_04955 [Alphaproteobacteria bacterium]|nr:hypothetical protein [Alphaproteobacteria bacterium]